MVEQVADGDGFSVGGELGKDVGEMVVVVEFAVVDEQHDARCGELLGERGQAEICLVVYGAEGAKVGNSVAAAEDGLAVVDDEDRGAGSGGGFQWGEDGVDLVGGDLGGGGGGEERECCE